MPCPGGSVYREEQATKESQERRELWFQHIVPLDNGQNWPDLLNLHILQWFLELKG